MRIACSACGTKYEIRDERVLGRVVKIRCKRCGEVVVVDATAPPKTGERHEDSVLFSLSMLAREPPTPEPPPRPGDDILHLSAGGPFAELAAPVLVPPVEEPAAPRSKAPIAVAVGLVVLAVSTVAWAFVREKPVREKPPSPPAPLAVVHEVVAEPVASTAPPPVVPSATVATRVVSRPAPTVAPTHTAEAPRCCPGETETACEMRRSVGASCGADDPFDAAAARSALGAVDLESCRRGSGGNGHVRITFEPDGSVSSAVVDRGPFVGTDVASCVASRYRGVRVHAFGGHAIAVGKSFSL